MEDLVPDPSRPQTSLLSSPSIQHLSLKKFDKYINTKLTKKTITNPISQQSINNLKKTEKFHSLSSGNYYENLHLNDISLNNNEFGLTVQSCPLRKSQITWKQIPQDNISKFKKTMKNNSQRIVNKFPLTDEIYPIEYYKIPSWMNNIRKLDQTFSIFNNLNNKTSDNDNKLEMNYFENNYLENNGNISEESSPFETSDSEFFETSRTILVSPTKFTNSENDTQLHENLEESKIESISSETKIEQYPTIFSNSPIHKNSDSTLDFPIKTKHNELYFEELTNNEPVKKKKRIENKFPIPSIKITENDNKLQFNNYEMIAIDSVESLIMRTKNLKINDESEIDLMQRKEQYGKLKEETNFLLERKLKEETKEQENDIDRNQPLEKGEIEEIRTQRKKKKFSKKSYNFDKRLKVLFKSDIPFQISASNIQLYDQFLKFKKKNRKEHELDDSSLFYSKQEENNYIDNNNLKIIESNKLSDVERKIQCNIDLLRSSTDSLISSIEESNFNNSDYCINETYIIKKIQKSQKEDKKYTLLPILENSNYNQKRNFRETLYWKRISKTPIHRLIGNEASDFREKKKFEKRNPKHYNLHFIPGKSR